MDYRNIVRLACCALGAASSLAWGAPIAYRVDPARTRVEYVITAFGVLKHRGRFERVQGDVVVDREAHRGQVDFTIDARSLDSGWDARDAFILDDALLDAAHHPEVRFHSSRLVFDDDHIVRIDGDLTLRGTTQPVSLDVARIACDGRDEPTCEAEATTTIQRSAFGMGTFVPLIDDAVRLNFLVVAHSIGAEARGGPEPPK